MKLDELRELREAATPGPWVAEGHYVRRVDAVLPLLAVQGARNRKTARLIALAPDLARLVEELAEALEQISEKARDDEFGSYASIADAALALLAELGER